MRQRHFTNIFLNKLDAVLQTRPIGAQRFRKSCSTPGYTTIYGQSHGGTVIKYQQDLRKQSVTTCKIGYSPPSEAASDPASNLSCLVQFLTRETACMADGPGDGVKQGVSAKFMEVFFG